MNDPFGLRRFEIAQDEGRAYAAAVSELRVGRKVSHWMWFVFPQISGLGQSLMSRTYAITSLAEAEAYLQHPVLGSRLIECTHILTEVTVSQAGFDGGHRRSRSGSDRPSSENDSRLATVSGAVRSTSLTTLKLADALPAILSLDPLRKQERSTQPDEATDGLDKPCGCGATCDGDVHSVAGSRSGPGCRSLAAVAL